MAREISKPKAHDNLFRMVYSDPAEAAGLLRPRLPEWLSAALDWPTLILQDGSYVDEDLRASQSDLLFEVLWRPGAGQTDAGAAAGKEPQPLRLYVLLEHQSTPGAFPFCDEDGRQTRLSPETAVMR